MNQKDFGKLEEGLNNALIYALSAKAARWMAEADARGRLPGSINSKRDKDARNLAVRKGWVEIRRGYYVITEKGIAAIESAGGRNEIEADWRMALRRKLNGDTR